jgi:site-specific DNA-methyltransferase (adenine-specific)
MKTDKNSQTSTTSGTLPQPEQTVSDNTPDTIRDRSYLGTIPQFECVNTSIPCNRIFQGDCIEQLRRFRAESVDFVLTDPPYLVAYKDRTGRSIQNDDNSRWLFPAFAELYRVLKPNSYCVSFYGWSKAERFLSAWKECGFQPVGHFVWVKRYASCVRHSQMKHEQAYLLAKGNPPPPKNPPADVLPWQYTGNKLHPTQKPVMALTPLIEAYSPRQGVVLDPFAGSGSTGVAALHCRRRCLLIEKDPTHYETIRARFENLPHHLTTAIVRGLPARRKILLSHMAALVKN